MNIFIGCSSSEYISDIYMEDSKLFLEELFSMDNNLIFGVCSKGLMGLSYEIAINNGRDVKGICPLLYLDELSEVRCSEEEITKTVGERTKKVIDDSDVLIFLPGGIGTIYELFTAIEWKRSFEFDKPIIIFNSLGHFDKLFEFLNMIYDNGFTSREIDDCYFVCDNAKDAIDYIDNYYIKRGLVKEKVRLLK